MTTSREHPPLRSRGLFLGGAWLRIVTRWRSRELDRRLAAGADPMESDQLALRVGQLGSRATRVRMACALRGAVAVATGHGASFAPARLRNSEIRGNEELLLALADRLCDGGPVGIRGLAMTSELLSEHSSPLHSERSDRPLCAVLLQALVELDRGVRTATPSEEW